tara:strand:- start:275 stop:529 length:255 start_codon:yes stop_codon:yes gene_type:complete
MVRSWFIKKENGKIIKFQTGKDMANYYNCSVRCLYNRIESDNKNKAKKFGTDKCFREGYIQYYCDTCRMPCDSKEIICSECEKI